MLFRIWSLSRRFSYNLYICEKKKIMFRKNATKMLKKNASMMYTGIIVKSVILFNVLR